VKEIRSFVRFKVIMAVMVMMLFWVLMPCRLLCRCQSFGEHTVSIFRAEVAILGSVRNYTELEKGKAFHLSCLPLALCNSLNVPASPLEP
jgi:hypothetical protein